MAALMTELQRAGKGEASLVFVEAPSGRGKSRLVREFLRRAETALILQGQGIDQGAQRPFQLLVGPAQQLVVIARNDPALRERIQRETADYHDTLCSILPELRDICGHDQRPNPQDGNFGEERSLRALLRLIGALGSRNMPALLIFDDCQWADEMALRFLSAWQKLRSKQEGQTAHLMVIAAFRSEEVRQDHPLRAMSPDASVSLDNLGDGPLREMLLSMASGIPEEAMRLVARLSGGSPFMAATVLRGFTELGILRQEENGWAFHADAVTQEMMGADQAILFLKRRIELLSPSVTELLKVAAILGKEFDSKLACSIAGCDNDVFAEAERRHIVRPLHGDGSYTFVHDKMREALLEMLSLEERRLYCLHIAATFEKQHQERIFDLAYFYATAQQYQRALPYALRAAEEARARASLQIAEQQYRIALKGLAENDRTTAYRAFRGLGEVLMLRGDYDQALELFEKARKAASHDMEAAFIEALVCETIFKTGDTHAARGALVAGLARLGIKQPKTELGASFRVGFELVIQLLHALFPRFFLATKPLAGSAKDLLIGRMLNQLAYVIWFDDAGLFRLFAGHLKALNILERYPPTVELTHTYSSHGPGMGTIGYYARGQQYCARAVKIATELKSAWSVGQAFNFYGIASLPASLFPECVDHCYEAARLLERTGDLWELNMANCNVAYGLYRAGNLREAIAWAQRNYREAMDVHDTTTAASALSVWSKASFGQVPDEEFARLRAITPKSAYQPHAEIGQAEAISFAARGDIQRAVIILEEQFVRVKRKRLATDYVLSVLPWLLTMLRLQLERSHRLSRNEYKCALRRGLSLSRKFLLLSHVFRNHLPHVAREYALFLLLAGEEKKARKVIEKSIRTAERIGSRFELAQSVVVQGRIESMLNLERGLVVLKEGRRLLQEVGALETFFRLENEKLHRPGEESWEEAARF